MSIIKGIQIKLVNFEQTGIDAFNHPITHPVEHIVDNVLVSAISSADRNEALNIYGKEVQYELCIPKGDNHTWEDSEVEFFGKRWKTVGFIQEWINEMVPLDWNRKIKVVRHG